MYITVQMGFCLPDETDFNTFCNDIKEAVVPVVEMDYFRGTSPKDNEQHEKGKVIEKSEDVFRKVVLRTLRTLIRSQSPFSTQQREHDWDANKELKEIEELLLKHGAKL